MERLKNALLLLISGALFNAGVQAAELIVFSSPDCSWCEVWEQEVGAIFPRTEEAKRLQLIHVDINDPLPSRLQDLETIKYTPTFVVLNQGREVGRIAGYSGEDFFWWELQEIMKRLPPRSP
jgi:thioredoxin-related protein